MKFLRKTAWLFCTAVAIWLVIPFSLFSPHQSTAAPAVTIAGEVKGRYIVFNGTFDGPAEDHKAVLIKLDTTTGAAWRYMQVSVAATNATYGPRQIMVGGWYPLTDDLATTIRKAAAAITDGQALAQTKSL